MAEERLMFIDIEPKSTSSAPEQPPWTCSDNTFTFNFTPPALQEKTSPPDSEIEPAASWISCTGQGTSFAFNFQIPPAPPVEDMETTETPDTSSPGGQQSVREEKPSPSPPEPSVQLKAKKKKKKKKSGKKNPSDSTEAPQTASSAEGSQGGEDAELSAEEQLNRQLDWCIEQLEVGMKTQKGTPKQKEEASRALKTLQSSKAPLAKKRQVMRAMNGDYRKKMEEEKSKQYKLIKSEIASSQVKVVPNSPKKSVFHRKAEDKTQTAATEENLQQDTDLKAKTQEETSAFVFTPSKEEFRFNFL